jgi:hypothetical protein
MSIATYAYDASRRCAHKFTGKDWDSESGLDTFGARYHGSRRVAHTSRGCPIQLRSVRLNGAKDGAESPDSQAKKSPPLSAVPVP